MERNNAERKTYVLVHGAFHGGWCWQDVATRLRDSGHIVHTPTLTGLGDRSHLLSARPTLQTHVEDVLQLFRFEGLENVILVGHSFGGSTISGVADRMSERLRHLVYFDALILQPGEASAELSPPGHFERYKREARPSPFGLMAYPREPEYFGIKDNLQVEWLAARLTPQPIALHEEKIALSNPVGNGVPVTYLACTSPYLASTARSRDFAKSREGWTYLEMNAPHNAMMTHPEEFTEFLDGIN